MKKENIKTQTMYGNGKEIIRKVLNITKEKVLFEIVEDGTKNKKSVGNHVEILTANFAKWAKYESGSLIKKNVKKIGN